MKMKQVADRIGKHDNTVRNYAKQFNEFLSPEPPKGEARTFTDDDVRILGFISRLSDSGMSYDDIKEAIKRKLTEGTPFPPVLPTLAAPEVQGLITVQEMESQLAVKDARIAEMEARLEELRKQIDQFRQERREERDVYTTEIGRLNQEIGELRAELKAFRGK
jgi:DNA-binding transcriptional MerR regulator